MAWPVIGKSFTPAEFQAYVQGLSWGDAFRPQFITIHNTAAPSLAQRPNGLTRQHILNLQSYYQGKGWKGGPHLFIDDRQIWVFNDLTKPGTHSPSWNSCAIGIEMLGDFDKESFTEGRGRLVRDNTMAAVAVLSNALRLSADSFKFHCEDTRTNHACPGKLARNERAALISEITVAMNGQPEQVVAEADAVPLAVDATAGENAGGILSNRTFAQVNELAEKGSRLAQYIRAIKRWWWTTIGVGGSAATLVDTKKGSANAFVQMVSDHPFIAMAVVGGIVAVVVYVAVKLVEKHLVTAARDGRYRPRGA